MPKDGTPRLTTLAPLDLVIHRRYRQKLEDKYWRLNGAGECRAKRAAVEQSSRACREHDLTIDSAPSEAPVDTDSSEVAAEMVPPIFSASACRTPQTGSLATMLISVGILAWNEERVIEGTLRSLLGQSALLGTSNELANCQWEIVVVANGCTDKTSEVSRKVLSELISKIGRSISWSVRDLQERGKSNAWNRFVHEYSSQQADLIAMLDADITFGQPDTLARTVLSLLADPRAVAAVDLPLKDALKKQRMSLIERISVVSSYGVARMRPALCGQFFVARGTVLRRVWMPKGLPVEDGFLGAMLVTNCLLDAEDHNRIIRAAGATHYYETITSFRQIFRHELRLVIGTALNCYLLWDFLRFATDPSGDGAGDLVRRQLERDPMWYEKLMANSIRNHGWWVIPRGMLFRRFSGHPRLGPLGCMKWLVGATVGLLFDVPVFLAANYRLKRLESIGYW